MCVWFLVDDVGAGEAPGPAIALGHEPADEPAEELERRPAVPQRRLDSDAAKSDSDGPADARLGRATRMGWFEGRSRAGSGCPDRRWYQEKSREGGVKEWRGPMGGGGRGAGGVKDEEGT